MANISDKTELANILNAKLDAIGGVMQLTLKAQCKFHRLDGEKSKGVKSHSLAKGSIVKLERFVYEKGKRSLSVMITVAGIFGSLVSSVPNIEPKTDDLKPILDAINYKSECSSYIRNRRQREREQNAQIIAMTKNMNLEHYRSW